MGAMPNEPSMEEILSSIKRIIADEDRATPRVPRRAAAISGDRIVRLDDDGDDQILELTEALTDESDSQEDEDVTEMPASRAKSAKPAKPMRAREGASVASLTTPDATVLSDLSAKAARDSLDNLSKMLVRGGEEGQSNTLEGLVREMLRPMLKEWLDKNLPVVVETMVKREIDRITGRV
jgi:cell pole-organizing protein PopZ